MRAPTTTAPVVDAVAGVEQELRGEIAATLGRVGETAQRRLEELRAAPADAADRGRLVQAAADAVQAYFVQRELIGLRNHTSAIRDYDISSEVLARMGVR